MKKEIALKKDIVVPLPVFIIRAIALSVKDFPELMGTHGIFFKHFPELIISVEDKGILHKPQETELFSLHQWYEESTCSGNKISMIERIQSVISPKKAANRFGTVTVFFPGKRGVDIAQTDCRSSLCFGIGSVTPLWTDTESEHSTRLWWTWITLLAPLSLDYKLLGKLLQSVGQRIQEADFPEIVGVDE
ncbi:hypothetical protein JXA84_03610 [candidate division WOR-3 bacterium]|nr:hypothetical protein [candidate division WOR-3 bacterium]